MDRHLNEFERLKLLDLFDLLDLLNRHGRACLSHRTSRISGANQ